MKSHFSSLAAAGICAVAVILLALRPPRENFDKIIVREFELVDAQGRKRVSIKVEENNEVVFRLKDQHEAIRVKIGAGEEGSGLVLLNGEINPGIQALAKQGASLTVTDKLGKKRTY